MTRFLFVIFCIPTIVFGQRINSTEKSGDRNVYNDAVKRLVRLISAGDQSFNKIYIQHDGSVTDSLRNTIGKTKVEIMDVDDIEQKVQTDTSFILYRVYPLSMENGKFFVNIVPFSVSREHGGLVFKNAGTFKISYSFDCSKAQLRYRELVAIDY